MRINSLWVLTAALFLCVQPGRALAQLGLDPSDADLVLFFTDEEGSTYFYDAAGIQRNGHGGVAVPLIVARSAKGARTFKEEERKNYLPYFTYALTLINCERGTFRFRGVAHFDEDQTVAEEQPGSGWMEFGSGSPLAAAASIVCATAHGGDSGPKTPPGGQREGSQPGRPLGVTSGTGFFINPQGQILTNYHVVEHSRSLSVLRDGTHHPVTLIAYDPEADLALLGSGLPAHNPLVFRGGREARHGEEVITIGFPMPDVLSTDISTTTGIVSSLAGAGNDPRHLLFTAPIQPGNSGGPLVDRYGTVVGVIVAKFDALGAAERTRDIPQNVNFAIKAELAKAFLTKAGARFSTRPPSSKLDVEDVVQGYKNSVVLIVNER
jgi:S1-C subfamily serine protease